MAVRRILFWLCLVTVLGCSGSSSLFLQNLSGKPISGTISAHKTIPGSKPRVDSAEFQLAEGDEREVLFWYSAPPDWIEIEYAWPNEAKKKKRYEVEDYPPGLAQGTSAGAYFYLEVRSDSLMLRDPNGWDRLRRNPQYAIVPLGFFACAVGITVWFIRQKRTK